MIRAEKLAQARLRATNVVVVLVLNAWTFPAMSHLSVMPPPPTPTECVQHAPGPLVVGPTPPGDAETPRMASRR